MIRGAETEVSIGEHDVKKVALTPAARFRLSREALCLTAFGESPHLPGMIDYDSVTSTLTLERIRGQSFNEVFSVNDAWVATPRPWAEAAPYLTQYIAAETDLLTRGAMCRGLNLEHLIFTDDKAVLVDHEETVGNEEDEEGWYYRSMRGTWETMAPEEFRGYGDLTQRTATYRAAVIAHVALSGELPFPRFPLRRDVHHWRKHHAPEVSQELPKSPRRVLRTGLDVRPERRQANPAQFFRALKSAYEDE